MQPHNIAKATIGLVNAFVNKTITRHKYANVYNSAALIRQLEFEFTIYVRTTILIRSAAALMTIEKLLSSEQPTIIQALQCREMRKLPCY